MRQSMHPILQAGCYFITGTDTDVGKTLSTKALIDAANAQQLTTLGYKPISAGCEQTNAGLRNEDALILQAASSHNVDYQWVNPIAFLPPIAPHIAAKEVNQAIDLTIVSDAFDYLKTQQTDLLFVEGAGGWHLPLDDQQLLSDWVVEQNLPVIVVVGLKLGCLNHALLTIKAVEQSGLKVAGWIANHIQANMPYAQDNIDSLKAMIKAPLLAEIPYLQDKQQNLAKYIKVSFKS